MVLFYLSVPFTDPKEIVLYAMAWAEWPLMLFGVMPILLERPQTAGRHPVTMRRTT